MTQFSSSTSPFPVVHIPCRAFTISVLILVAMLIVPIRANAEPKEQLPRPLYIMNSDGTNLRQFTQLVDHECSGSPTWSPDGKKVFFDAWRKSESANQPHLYSVNADGTRPKELTEGAMPSVNPLSPTQQTAFHRYGTQQGVWVGARRPTLVEANAGSPRWHPHEPKLAYVKWSGGIAMRKITGSEIGEEEIIVPAKYAPYVGFSWSPDGKGIAFYSSRNGEDKAELMVMNITDIDNKPQVKATGKLGWIVSWSPDGKQIVFTSRIRPPAEEAEEEKKSN